MKKPPCTLALTALFLLLVCSFLITCSKSNVVAALDVDKVIGTWKVIAIEETGEEVRYLDTADTVLVVFEENGILRGRSHGLCGNYFSGRYELGPKNVFSVDSLITSEALCPQSMYVDFLEALGLVKSARMNREVFNDLKDTMYLNFSGSSGRIWLNKESD